MKLNLSIVVGACALALLSACGGGSDAPSQTVGPEGLHITSANETAVARASVSGGLSVAQVQTATDAGGSGVQPTSVSARAHSLATVSQRALAAGVRSRMTVASTSAHPATAISDTEPCGVSGSLTTTFDDRDNNSMLSAGDVLTVAFDQCRDSATSLLNGAACSWNFAKLDVDAIEEREQVADHHQRHQPPGDLADQGVVVDGAWRGGGDAGARDRLERCGHACLLPACLTQAGLVVLEREGRCQAGIGCNRSRGPAASSALASARSYQCGHGRDDLEQAREVDAGVAAHALEHVHERFGVHADHRAQREWTAADRRQRTTRPERDQRRGRERVDLLHADACRQRRR